MSAFGTKLKCPAARQCLLLGVKRTWPSACKQQRSIGGQSSANNSVGPSQCVWRLRLALSTARDFTTSQPFLDSGRRDPSGHLTSPSAPPPENYRPNCVRIQSYLAPGPTLRGVSSLMSAKNNAPRVTTRRGSPASFGSHTSSRIRSRLADRSRDEIAARASISPGCLRYWKVT
jgi:hypothetical protein